MKTIHKFGLEIGSNSLDLPDGAQVLTAQEQGGRIQMWVLVNPEVKHLQHRKFHVYGTGDTLPVNPGRYIATVQRGWTVWHVFEEVA